MKKNIKFIGAAAAALLAVAPVVASTTTANAAVTVNNAPVTTTDTAANALNLNVSLSASAGTSYQSAVDSVKASVEGATVKGFDTKNVSIVTADGKAVSGDLKANTAYKVVIKNISLEGLTTGKDYTIGGGTISGIDGTTTNGTTTYTAKNLANSFEFTSEQFYLTDTNASGTPYFVNNNNTVVTSASVSVPTGSTTTLNVSDVVAQLKQFTAKISASGSNQAIISSQPDYTAAVKSALTSAGITVAANGNFTVPASNVLSVNLTASATNGKSVTLPVAVSFNTKNISDAQAKTYPVITFKTTVTDNGTKKEVTQTGLQANNNTLNAATTSAMTTNGINVVSLNGSVNTTAIKNAFSAVVSSTDNSNLSISVDTSKVNTSVAGTYPVTVSATNPSGKTTSVVFNMTVGKPGATYKAVQTDGNIYTVSGNTASKTTSTVSAGQNLATYGEVTIGGVSYTRINSASSNQFVETSVFTAEQTTSKTIMHIAQYYNNKGEKTTLNGKSTVGAYNEVQVVTEPVTINGAKYYKIAGQNAYIKVGNIDGTSRKLTHNAYIYNNKGKRVQKNTVLKKGTSKTTYGSSFKINGKAYYRIGKNQYVKKANF